MAKIFRFRRKVRTPFRPQFQTTECGVGVLRTMLAHFGREVSAREVRRISGVSRDCLNAADLRRAARSLGLLCDARTLETKDLANVELPVVIHLRFIHFVVLESFTDRTVRIMCPAHGNIEQRVEEFDQAFTGIVLSMRPGPGFKTNCSRKKGQFHRWWWPVEPTDVAYLAVAFTSIAFRAMGVILLARTLAGYRRSPTAPEALALIVLGSIMDVSSRLKLDTRLYTRLRRRVVDKLRKVSHSFYVYRLPDVLFDVCASLQRITRRLSNNPLPAALASGELLLLLWGALKIDRRTGLLLVANASVWCAAVAFLSLWRRRWEVQTHHGSVDETSRAATAMQNLPALKLGEGPNQTRNALQGSQATEEYLGQRTQLARSLLRTAPMVLSVSGMLLVLLYNHAAAPARATGMVLLAAALGVAATPLTRMRGVLSRLRHQSDLVMDVLDEPETVDSTSSMPSEDSTLHVEAVTFGFNPLKSPTLRNVFLTLHPGEQVGLTGPSGDGKSTLTEIIAGLHQPLTGRVLLGGTPLLDLSPSVRPRYVARVDRRPFVFEGSLRENLLLWDESISEEALANAIRDAALDEVVAHLPNGLDTTVEAEGRNFSGGQLQRLEIARALARNPRVLLLDDALDAIDLATEGRIRDALRRRGCTLLLVGHRASSLQACDRVLYLADGELRDGIPTQRKAERRTNLAVFTAPEQPRPDAPIGARAAQLCTAFQKVTGGAQALDPKTVSDLPPSIAIEQLAEESGLNIRRVRFVMDEWWRQDLGRVLAFRKDGSPVAIISGPLGNNLFDPLAGRSGHLTSCEIQALDADAYTLTKPEVLAPETLSSWGRYLLAASGTRLLTSQVFTITVATVVLLMFFVAAHGPGLRAFVTGSQLCAALAVFWYMRTAAVDRTSVRLGEADANLLQALLVRFDPHTAKFWKPERLFQGFDGLAKMKLSLREFYDRYGISLVLLPGSLLSLLKIGGAGVLLSAVCGALLTISAPPLAAWASWRWETEHLTARLAARRFLSATLWGIRRLYSLDRTKAAFRRWLVLDNEQLRRQQRHVVLPAVLGSLRVLLSLLPALAVGFTASHRPDLPLLVSLACITGCAARQIGTFSGRLVAQTRARQVASALLNQAHEHGTRAPTQSGAPIKACGLECSYPGASEPIFSRLSLEIDPRKITILCGPSGGGKSTLLRLMLHMQRAQSGILLVGGLPIEQVDVTVWRRRIAGIFQGDMLEDAMTIRRHLAGDSYRTLHSLWAALETVELAEEIRRMPMGLQTIVNADTLSHGQQQRLMIARALLSRPEFLVMDEATQAIPDAIQASVLAHLRSEGIGCLLVTHRETLIEAADVVHYIDHGIRYSGPPSGLHIAPDEAKELVC